VFVQLISQQENYKAFVGTEDTSIKSFFPRIKIHRHIFSFSNLADLSLISRVMLDLCLFSATFEEQHPTE
jgi:hypothetical protein